MDDSSRSVKEWVTISEVFRQRPDLRTGDQSPDPLDLDAPTQQVL